MLVRFWRAGSAALILNFALCVWTGFLKAQSGVEGHEFRYSASREEIAEVDGQWRYIGVEAVRIEYRGTFVRANHVVMWLDRRSTGDGSTSFVPAEIYAEGEILFRKGDEVVSCHQLYLDVQRNRGVFIEATLAARAPQRGEEAAIFVRTQELRQLAATRFEAEDVSLTTCSFGEPHYHVRSDHVLAQIDSFRDPRAASSQPEELNVRLEVDTSVLHVGGLPVFALPSFVANTATLFGSQFSLVKSFSLDNSRRFGVAARLSLGDDIYFDEAKWGEWTVHTQYLGDRGFGGGVDLTYKTDDYRGELRSLYQNDRGVDELSGEPPDHDRGRIRLQHRHQLPEDIQLDVEFALISDIGFLPEYFEREFKSDKEQETLLYLKRAVENRALTFLAKTRVNEFQEQVEHLPQIGYNLISEPLVELGDFSTIYFDADYEFTSARRRYSNLTTLNDEDTHRVDLDNVISAPLFLGPVKVRPFGGLRYTKYGNGRLVDKSINRVGTLYGVNLTSELWRTYGVAGGPFDLFGLRHVIVPELEYHVIDHVSHDPTDLVPIDRVDRLIEEEALVFGIRNRLETIWTVDDEDLVVDVFDLDIEWTWYPQADRDNFGEHAGNIDVDWLVRPSRELTFLNDFEYSFVLNTIEVFNATLAWAPGRSFQGAIGYRRFVDVNDTVFLQTNFRLTEKWEFEIHSGFDFVEERFQDQRLTLRRIGHDWILELELGFDNGADDFGIGIAITPRVLYDPRFKVRSLRHEPQFQTFGEGLIR